MKWPWAQATWENSIKANVALSFVALIVSVIALVAVVSSNSKHERIVLTPMVVDKQMAIGWDSADEAYLKAFGLSVAILVGNLTPENTAFVVESLSQFMHPAIYPDMRKKILAVATTRQFIELAGATRYWPSAVEYERESGKIFVTGVTELSTATGKEKTPMTYEMSIRVESGRPAIYLFNNYPDVPHTKEWLTSHPISDDKGEEVKK